MMNNLYLIEKELGINIDEDYIVGVSMRGNIKTESAEMYALGIRLLIGFSYCDTNGLFKEVELDKIKRSKLANIWISNFFSLYEKALAETAEKINETTRAGRNAMFDLVGFVHDVGNNIRDIISATERFCFDRKEEVISRYDRILSTYGKHVEKYDEICGSTKDHYYNEAITKRVGMSGIESLIKKYARR